MKKLVLLFTFASATLFAKTSYNLVHVNDVWTAMNQPNAKIAVLDANNAKTRKTYGSVQGATLLTSYNKFNVAKELPADKTTKLVFYCANEKCTASHKAAEIAKAKGFTDVNVMAEGIEGWKEAGKPTTKI